MIVAAELARSEWPEIADRFSARLSFRPVREVEPTEDRISPNARARLADARGSFARGERVVWRLHLIVDDDRDLSAELADDSGRFYLPGSVVENDRFTRRRDAESAAPILLAELVASLRSVEAFWDVTDGGVDDTVLGLF